MRRTIAATAVALALAATPGGAAESEGTTSAGLAERGAFARLRVATQTDDLVGYLAVVAFEGAMVETIDGRRVEGPFAAYVFCVDEGACSLREPEVGTLAVGADGTARLEAADAGFGALSVAWAPMEATGEAKRGSTTWMRSGHVMRMHYDLNGIVAAEPVGSAGWHAGASGTLGGYVLSMLDPAYHNGDTALALYGTVHLDWA